MRKQYIDNAKGICIGLVVLGHICRRNWEGTVPIVLIYTINVQAFFIISGLLIEETREYKKSWKGIIIGNSLRLLILYFVFEMLYNLTYSLLNGFSTFRWQAIDTLIFYGRGIATWFLPALFIAKMLVFLFIKIGHDKVALYGLSGVLFGIGLYHKQLFPAYTMWQAVFVFRVFIGTGFLATGILLSRRIEKIISNKIAVFFLFPLYLLAAIMNGQVSTYLADLNNPLLYAVAAVSGTIVLLAGCRSFSNCLFEYWGRNSIVILGTHQAILYVFFFTLGRDYMIFTAALIWIITMLLEFPIIEVVNRWFPFLIGKKRKREHCDNCGS